MRGRKPTPNKLKKLAGNPGKRDIKDSVAATASAPRCPVTFRGEAKREWKRISSALYELGLLSEIDHAALEAYCVEYERWCEAERQVRELGLMCLPPEKPNAETLFGKTGPHVSQLVWNPYLAIASKSMERMLKLLAEFGMTPSSRARLSGSKPEQSDGSEAFFFGADDVEDHVQ